MKSVRFPFFCAVFLLLSSQVCIYSSSSGVTNATRKFGPSGCSCHGGAYVNADTSVKVLISGPDTLLVNTTGIYTVTISGGAATRSGVNIAVSSGSLSTNGSTILKLTNSELTHKSPVSYSNGSVVFTFQYKAGGSADSITMYAAGSSAKAWNFADDKIIHVVKETAVVRSNREDKEFYLLRNYPNPCNPATKILYDIPVDAKVTLHIYSISGKFIRSLGQSLQKAGRHSVNFDGTYLPSGIYLCKMEAQEYNSGVIVTRVCKIILTK
jgi:hypothetical protein